MQGRISIPVIALAALVAATPSIRAAEQITLTNGFVERCDHHAQVDGRMRLYLSAGEDNYIELPPGQIASFEAVPDPPPIASPAPHEAGANSPPPI